jgi:hypothetical protein
MADFVLSLYKDLGETVKQTFQTAGRPLYDPSGTPHSMQCRFFVATLVIFASLFVLIARLCDVESGGARGHVGAPGPRHERDVEPYARCDGPAVHGPAPAPWYDTLFFFFRIPVWFGLDLEIVLVLVSVSVLVLGLVTDLDLDFVFFVDL